MARVTLRDVATRAGVSTAAASYVLSGRGARGPAGTADTRRRVLEAASELGYRPNQAARVVRTGRSSMFLVHMPLNLDPWVLSLVEAIRRRAEERGLDLLLLPGDRWFDVLRSYPVHGAFLAHVPDDAAVREQLRAVTALGVRLVVDSDTVQPDGFDVIAQGADRGAALATTHVLPLLEGRRLGHLAASGPDGRLLFPERGAAVSSVAADPPSGEVPVNLVRGTARPSQMAGMNAALDVLRGDDPPRAIVCDAVSLGLGAVEAVHQLGLRVPHDVAVIAVGDVAADQRGVPSLAHVGVEGSFARLAELALPDDEAPRAGGVRHQLGWRVHPGGTA